MPIRVKNNKITIINNRVDTSLLFRSDTPHDEVLVKAKETGASHLLLLTVDRPISQWINIKLECHDLKQGPLWVVDSGNGSWVKWGMSAVKDATKDVIEDFEKQLEDFPLTANSSVSFMGIV